MYSTEKVSKWFEDYTERFKTDGELPQMLKLKKNHSRRVCELSGLIADSMEWDEPGDGWLAYAVGLLHDVGRFPQYRDYGTFFDAASVDHGDLAAEILDKEFDWSDVPEKTKPVVLTAIKYHNKKEVSPNLPLVTYKWASLIRDADKIDIFHMIQSRIDNGTIFDLLPRHKKFSGLSQALVEEVRKNGTGSFSNAKSLQDFRLIQLTWGCDLNFPVSVATIREEGLFGRICDDLRPYGIDDLLDTLMERIASI